MFITLSILLLFLFVLGFWIVKESNTPLALKICAISLFFFFCAVFGTVMESSVGWAASGDNLPEIITIRHIVIKEPNQQLNFGGSIYLLLEMSSTKTDSLLLNLFGHKTEGSEPRLFKIPYSRSLHEQLQSSGVMGKLMKGQLVKGKLLKGKDGKFGLGKGSGNGEGEGEGEGDGNGQGGGRNGRGRGHGQGNGRGNGGSDSSSPDFMFYELPPSFFQQKH